MTKVWLFAVAIAALLATAACTGRAPSQKDSAEERDRLPAQEKAPSPGPVTFIDRVWVVAESEQVALGEVRVFLSDGTLVMASPHATPTFGSWSYQDERLTITEEGQQYDVDILELTRDTFRIRMHSPGEPVVIRFEPAAGRPITLPDTLKAK